MSTTLTRWRDGVVGPLDWTGLFQVQVPAIRVEQFIEHDHYVVRAELPGFDPESGVDATVTDGILKITAERREEKREKAHSEFHYGRFVRTVVLPAGVEEKTAVATYHNGLLEVAFTLGTPEPTSTKIKIDIPPVDTASGAKTIHGIAKPANGTATSAEKVAAK